MTPTLLSAFWTYTLITALTPGPNNILALSSATSHGFRQSTRVLAGMSLGFLIVMLLCAGISFSLAVIDPAAVRLLSWAGAAYIVWLAMIGTFGNVCWALAGHLFQRLFRHYGRQLNIVLALLLVYCAVRIFY
ncbi:LysE family transporter [Escherichia albertii]|uniref:LysE family transporter n=1 Tax=Escherichia albertii TaxID=208962 RepID=UPI0039BF276C